MLRNVNSSTAITEASEEFFNALIDFIAEGRHHHADRLGRDDPVHQHGGCHAERLTRRDLSPVDPEHPGAQDFGDEGSLVGGEREAGGADRRELYPDMRQRIVDEHQLQDERRPPEDHRVGAGEPGEQPEAAQLHARQNQSHQQPAAEPQTRHGERKADALEKVRQRKIMDKQCHQFVVRIRGSSRKPASSDHFLRNSVSIPAF